MNLITRIAGVLSDKEWNMWEFMARAILLAIREPTAEMLKAGSDACFDKDCMGNPTPSVAACWRAMIDVARKGQYEDH